jgi:hypothetical protein
MFLGRDVADILPLLGKLLVSVTAGALLGFQRPGSVGGSRARESMFVGFVGLVGFLATTVGADLSGDGAGRLVAVGAGLLACAPPAVLGRKAGREVSREEVMGAFVQIVSYLCAVAFALGDNAVGAGTTLVCVLGSPWRGTDPQGEHGSAGLAPGLRWRAVRTRTRTGTRIRTRTS